jgi:hypothetical protein
MNRTRVDSAHSDPGLALACSKQPDMLILKVKLPNVNRFIGCRIGHFESGLPIPDAHDISKQSRS